MYKKALRTPLEDWSSQSINLLAGGLGGLSATLITQPFDMIKTRMQLQPQEYTSIWRSLAKVTTEEGLGAYFSGMLPRLVRKPLQSMIAWSVYEEACRRMQKS
jgi:solute carrier family 25 protein 38